MKGQKCLCRYANTLASHLFGSCGLCALSLCLHARLLQTGRSLEQGFQVLLVHIEPIFSLVGTLSRKGTGTCEVEQEYGAPTHHPLSSVQRCLTSQSRSWVQTGNARRVLHQPELVTRWAVMDAQHSMEQVFQAGC
jgi:hypothetical protein